ncbi:MAG: ABC transporter substrate-binding protein [Gammaproteobacteria bacterium]|nr:ABC transporter substrate-binding protein [Gammaproteobacteria bacterium]
MFRQAIMILALAPLAFAASAAPGVDAERILFGQTACFTGPNEDLGNHYRTGILAAFAERNSKGGVAGKTLELLSLDDGYEPDQAAANAESFVSEREVFAVIGAVGTPTSRRIAPMLRNAGIPFIGPLTGADFLRDAERYPNVVNLRASYLEEIERLIDYMIQKGGARFGIIYQDDAFGRTALRSYKALMDERAIPILARSAYTRNTHAVHTSLFSMEKADLDAILLVGTYAANSTIINLANSLGQEYLLANLSYTVSHELKELIDEPNSRILVTEVVPDTGDSQSRIVASFRRAISGEAHGEELHDAFTEDTLEGYILGRFVIAVLERMEGELTRENFLLNALSPEPVELDDWKIEFLPGSNTGSRYIRLTNLGTGAGIAESGS